MGFITHENFLTTKYFQTMVATVCMYLLYSYVPNICQENHYLSMNNGHTARV